MQVGIRGREKTVNHIMKPSGILAAILFSCFSIAANAQEFEITIIGHTSSLRNNRTLNVDPDDMGCVSGHVISSHGHAIAGANVVLYDGLNFYCVRSKRDGTYRIGGHFGVHVIEVSIPGYRKFSGEADVPKGGEETMDIVLEPVSDGIAEVRSAGNGVSCHGNAITFTVNAKHPAYKDKTMLDVLRDVPMVAMDDGKFAVADNESVEFFLNGNPFKAPYATALKYFASIGADKVKSVRVMSWGNATSAWVSVSYKE